VTTTDTTKPTPEQLLRLLRQQGYSRVMMIQGFRAIEMMDDKPGLSYERAFHFVQRLDQGERPAKETDL